MMLHGQSHTDHPTLQKYIDGWLHYKEKRKYEKKWFVLKGQVFGGGQLTAAFLFCFKDQNTHVKNHFLGSTQISQTDTVELHKEGNDSKGKCDFTIKINDKKLHFRAQDNIERDRWIYALVDLVGQQLPPSTLPNLNNDIRPRKHTTKHKLDKGQESFVESSPILKRHLQPTYRQSLPNIATPGDWIMSTPSAPFLNQSFNSNEQHYEPGRNPSPISPIPPNLQFSRASHGSLNVNLNASLPSSTIAPVMATLNGRKISDALNSRRRTMPNVQIQTSIQDTRLSSLRKMSVTSGHLGNCPWYYGPMSRNEAEEALQSQPVGNFLLRDCQSQKGCFTLTFKDKQKMKNHMIVPAENNQFQFTEMTRLFTSPEDGVLHYMDMKKNSDFHPKPYIMRSPGDGQEDDSYLQTDEIHTEDVFKSKKNATFRPPLLKSPSLPGDFDPQLGPFNENKLSSNFGNNQRSTSQPYLPDFPPNQRKLSNIELPTYLRKKPGLKKMGSLEDYEQMSPHFSPSRTSSHSSLQNSFTSIQENEKPAYLFESEINTEMAELKKLEKKSHSYVNAGVQPESEPSTSRKTSYNQPLPPTPENAELQSRDFANDENPYLEMEPELTEEAQAETYENASVQSPYEANKSRRISYNQPLPPTPEKVENDTIDISTSDEQYLEVDQESIKEDLQNYYANASVQSQHEPSNLRGASYNHPLPPTPQETALGSIEPSSDAEYVEIDPETVTGFEFNAPLPPIPDVNISDDHGLVQTDQIDGDDNGYLKMEPAGSGGNQLETNNSTNGYVVMVGNTGTDGTVPQQQRSLPVPPSSSSISTTDNTGYCEVDIPNGYVKMNEANTGIPTTQTSMKNEIASRAIQNQQVHKGSMILPRAPQTHIKRIGGSIQLQKPPMLSHMARQPSDPFPTKTAKGVSENTSMLKKLSLSPLRGKKNKHTNNNVNDAPPQLPPRVAKPQLLPNQKSIS